MTKQRIFNHSNTNKQGTEALRSLFYFPMLIVYFCVMLYFLSKVILARRIAKKRADIFWMSTYLSCTLNTFPY